MKSLVKSPLQELFQAIARSPDEVELKQSVMARVGEYFAAKRWMLYSVDQFPTIDQNSPKALKLALSLEQNPVLRYLVQNHAAVHDELVLPPGVWRTICNRPDHGHVMVGPIVDCGQLAGGLAFTRHRDDPAFNGMNLADLSALCLHVSTRLAELRSQGLAFDCDRITPREAQIAKLVAQGLTNKAIGENLWITENSVKQALKRIFRKLEVSSRAEMVARLSGLK
ncbi:MAG: LuxR C-terminal-related transcriptional regulator [Cyanobacteria bacterium P01_E01_bin.42]